MSTLDDRAKTRARLRATVFDAGGPAFPMHDTRDLSADTVFEEALLRRGMALRDYFAAHAPPMPQNLRRLAHEMETNDGKDTSDFGAFARYEAAWRWAYADRMLLGRDEPIQFRASPKLRNPT